MLQHVNHKFFLIKVKCVTKQHFNEVLLYCRDTMAQKSCSPDLRRHFCCVKTPTNLTSNCKVRKLCLSVIRICWELFIPSTQHLAGLLLRIQGSAVSSLQPTPNKQQTLLMWSNGETDINKMEISMMIQLAAVMRCSEKNETKAEG